MAMGAILEGNALLATYVGLQRSPIPILYGYLKGTIPAIYIGVDFLASGITGEPFPISTFIYKNLKNIPHNILEAGASIKKRALSKLESLSSALYFSQLSR